jgi:hypothetical protein
MPAYWLLKSEPESYSYADLERDGATVWDGVANNAALMYLRRVQPGDLALIDHTGDERRAVGVAEVVSGAYPDPKLGDEKLAVMDLRALRRLPTPAVGPPDADGRGRVGALTPARRSCARCGRSERSGPRASPPGCAYSPIARQTWYSMLHT